MSTRKTEHFGLHAWEAGDSFLRSEFNENFAMLDEAVRVVAGTYTGDKAAERSIELGFAPKAVLVTNSEGEMNTGYHSYGGLALPGFPATPWLAGDLRPAVELTEDGFKVFYFYRSSSSYSVNTNDDGTVYYFVAIE